MMNVAVTGANGFVGRVLIGWLTSRGHRVRAIVRSKDDRCTDLYSADLVETGDMAKVEDWTKFVEGIDAIVHLAGRVHAMGQLDEQVYLRENVEVTASLATAARNAGVSHFVFVSSIKVNGESTLGHPFTAVDVPSPQDSYARSKYEAELRLAKIAEGGMRLTIIRPPLVYGPRVGANFARLLRLVRSRVPLPFGSVTNKRSLVSVWNLCDLILTSLQQAGPHQQTLLVADDEVLSTAELISTIARAMDLRVRLFPVPLPMLQALALAVGREAELSRLTSSLVIDATRTRASLSWSPPLSAEEGLRKTVEDFMRSTRP